MSYLFRIINRYIAPSLFFKIKQTLNIHVTSHVWFFPLAIAHKFLFIQKSI